MKELKTKVKYHRTQPKFEVQILLSILVQPEDIMIETQQNRIDITYKNKEQYKDPFFDSRTENSEEWTYECNDYFGTYSFNKCITLSDTSEITDLVSVLKNGILTISGVLKPIDIKKYGVTHE